MSGEIPLYCIYVDYSYSGFPLCQPVWLCNLHSAQGLPLHEPGEEACCCCCIMENQPDFKNQKSLVQEVIMGKGHLCISLPKFHCELNFIEFFWGSVKWYLYKHYDMTFETLKANMPAALNSVPLATICQWEHHTHRWMDAYKEGLSTLDAQLKVKTFSSVVIITKQSTP